MHQLVLSSATGGEFRVFLAHAFDHDFFGATDAGAVLQHRRAIKHHLETLVSLTDHLRVAELVGHFGGCSAFARREDKCVGRVELGGNGNFHSRGEVGFGLARESDDHIGGHGKIADGGARLRESLEIPLRGIAAVHGGQHRVTA